MSYSSYTTDKASPFTRAVVSAMRKLYPEELADKSFDNTGLLLEAPFDPIRRQMNSVLLTIDLTKAVADEAIDRKDCVVVAYHPIIFKGLKSLTLADTQQQSLLRLALEGISVYCPHTAVDAAPRGLGDWLADIVTGTLSEPEPETHTAGTDGIVTVDPAQDRTNAESAKASDDSKDSLNMNQHPDAKGPSENLRPPLPPRPFLQRQYSRPTYPRHNKMEDTDLVPSKANHTRRTLHPSAWSSAPPGSGMGRLVTFTDPQPLTHLIERIARGVGTPKGFPVAIPQSRSVEDITIRSVAICAGSGASVLHDIDADLYFTGELSHHDALAATEKGRCVVTLFHSNSERGFLHGVLRGRLTAALKEEWEKVRADEERKVRKIEEEGGESGDDGAVMDGWEEALQDDTVEVEVSERDRDPFGIVILQSSEVEGVNIEGEGSGSGKGDGGDGSVDEK